MILFFDSDSYQDFYLVIDTWDNSHDRDADPLDEVVVADVTVITEERTFVLPPWTVPLLFFAMIAALVVVPFILNSRYMNAGNDGERWYCFNGNRTDARTDAG
jgi:hypothetical protein